MRVKSGVVCIGGLRKWGGTLQEIPNFKKGRKKTAFAPDFICCPDHSIISHVSRVMLFFHCSLIN